MTQTKLTYKDAGVDIDSGNQATARIKKLVKSTYNKKVLSEVGAFGGFYSGRFAGYKKPVLISSADGVGTKLKLAFMTGIHDTIGEDLVNHCTNDILVHGALPLYFLDYFATGKLKPGVVEQVITGLARGCKNNNCSLIGGEIAEMPGFYRRAEYDLAGFIVGIVDRSRIIDGGKIKPGHVIIGLESSGLHTNGYSLVRKLFFDRLKYPPSRRIPELGGTLAEELLKVHRSYLKVIKRLLVVVSIKGLAHITGGGIPGNLVRILPAGCRAVVDTAGWQRGAIFDLIQKLGSVDDNEMYRTFNMGIGMIVVCGKKDADRVIRLCRRNDVTANVVGEIVKGGRQVILR
ncbi:MAG: phosphoribosylformylglycinamidine cyclo-ligase [candidate division Zixibacteria bacterium]|nr:phosphoribosylformylglycinamidine cyclo-ligase [candidate division Zixibacteria bacterium]